MQRAYYSYPQKIPLPNLNENKEDDARSRFESIRSDLERSPSATIRHRLPADAHVLLHDEHRHCCHAFAGWVFISRTGLVSSVIALAIFLIGPRLGKLVDERGQSRVVPFATLVSLTGLVALLITVQFHGPLWILFIASVFVGCIPSAQALSRARWVYLLRMGKLGEKAPNVTTIFSYEGILDDIGFMIAPALSIFLASSFTPIAGLAVGGVSFLIGATLLTHAKETEPHPGWRSAADTASSDGPTPNSSTPEKGEAPAKEKKSLFRTSRIVRVLFVLMLLLGSFFGTFDTTSVAFAEELGEPNIASGALMLLGARLDRDRLPVRYLAPRNPPL